MLLHLPFERRDLFVEGGQYGRDRAGGGRVRAGDDRIAAELLAAQHGLDADGLGVEVAAAGVFERGPDLAAVQLRRRRRVRRLAQQLQRVGGVQVLEGLQRGREILAQHVPQTQHVAGAFPDQRLMHPGNHFDRLRHGAVGPDGPQLVRVGADHVGQDVRIGGVALGAGHAVAFPISSRLQRVHRVHGVAGGEQGGHPWAAVGLGPDQHLGLVGVFAELLADHRVQPGDPGHALRQPRPGQPAPGLVHQLDIVMIFRPIVSHE